MDPTSLQANRTSAPRAWPGFISLAARLALGGVWLWAGIAKVADPDAAVRSVRAYRLVPEAAVRAVAWGLPFVEIALGVLLLVGLGIRISAVISIVLLAVYVGGIASAWSRGLSIECGCFGGGGAAAGITGSDYVREILRDLGFAVPAVWLAITPRSPLSMERNRFPSP